MKKKTITGETISQEIEALKVETPQLPENIVEPTIEPNIFDTYRKYIKMANSNYIHDLQYGDAMKMLRYIEKEVGHNISFSMSCPSCLINLVQMFGRLEKK